MSIVRDSSNGFKGLPLVTDPNKTFLTGGTLGRTLQADITSGFNALQKVRVNTVVPLFSRDSGSVVSDLLTDSNSVWTIDSVHASLKTHLALMSNIKNRNERNGFASLKDTFAASKTTISNLAAFRISCAIQDVKVLNSEGSLVFLEPWANACVAAGLQAGAPVGEPMTLKFGNVSGIRHDSDLMTATTRTEDFDPNTQFDEAIDFGILFMENPPEGGFRYVVGNTTYGKDSSFIFNRISVIYAADTFAYNLRRSLVNAFGGVSQSNVSPETVRNYFTDFAADARVEGWIVADDTNDGRGWKNLTVEVDGSTFNLSVIITPAQGVDFLLTDIIVDTIRASA